MHVFLDGVSEGLVKFGGALTSNLDEIAYHFVEHVVFIE